MAAQDPKLMIDLTEKQAQIRDKIGASGHGNIRRLIGILIDNVGDIIDDEITPTMLIALLEKKQLHLRDLINLVRD